MQVPEIKYPVYSEVLKQILIGEGLLVCPCEWLMTVCQNVIRILCLLTFV